MDVGVDAKDPADRTASQRRLRGQQHKLRCVPEEVPDRSDRAIDAPVQKKTTKRKTTKRKPKGE